ncbi:MAG: DUF3137 domain-containing protein [Prevotellaceae bacterium]|jgi:hypothetical protein|nr:DUF3137 domain-containing protein [Prevotellaceae bacterium]
MNNKSEEQQITSVCQSLIPKLQSLEDERIKIRKYTRNFWLISLLVAGCTVCFLYMRQIADIVTWVSTAIIIVGVIVFYVLYVSGPLSKFSNRFKDEVIRALISSFLPDSSYKPDNHVSMNEYYNSALFKNSVDRYSGKNYVEGVVDKTAVRFSELHTEYKTTTRTKNGGTQTHWHTIFQGLFMIADANKHFNARTYILPDFSQRVFGGLGKWLQKNFGDSRGQVVYLENPVFEKKFAVYTTDPVEARYLITPQMQERMIRLADHVGGGVSASFADGKLYLAIVKKDGLFQLNTSPSLLNVNTLKYYANEITDILSVVHILDLNTRIWGKD